MKKPVLSCWSVLYVLGLLLASDTTVWGQEVKNLATQKEGGHLVFFTSQYNNTDWKAEHLIDGSSDKGWAGQNKGA